MPSATTLSVTRLSPCYLSGLFAGLAGVLYASQNKFAAPDCVFFMVSGEVVIFNVIGGMGTLVGPVAGAAGFFLLREVLSRFLTEYYLIPVGIIFTLMVIFIPQGLLGFLRRRLHPSSMASTGQWHIGCLAGMVVEMHV